MKTMKKSLLELAKPMVTNLYKRFQQQHPVAAMIIGVLVIGIWAGLTAIIQSGMLVGTSFEQSAISIQNVLSFVSMLFTLFLNGNEPSLLTTQKDSLETKSETEYETKTETKKETKSDPASRIIETEQGSIMDIIKNN